MSYDPRDIIAAIERLGAHAPDVAQRLLDATRLRQLRGATLGHERCDRLATLATATGCAEDYASSVAMCESVITEAQERGLAAAQALCDYRRVAGGDE